MQEVRLAPRSPDDLARVLGLERLQRLTGPEVTAMREALKGRSVINVNSTPVGGGVAEMLQVLLPLARGLGVDARWLVVDGDDGVLRHHQAAPPSAARLSRRRCRAQRGRCPRITPR